jgi:hypothetical protein
MRSQPAGPVVLHRPPCHVMQAGTTDAAGQRSLIPSDDWFFSRVATTPYCFA